MKYILLFTLIAFACKKAPNRTCLKKTGTPTHEKVSFEQIKKISVYNDINIKLVQDSLNFIEIDSYDNIKNFISINFEANELILKNNNKCRFLRDYDKQTTVRIHFSNLEKIALYGKGSIESENSIENPKFHVYAHSSNSNIKLSVTTNELIVEFVNGTLDGEIKGYGKHTYIFHAGYSNVNFIDLITEQLRIVNGSYSDTYVNVSNSIDSKIEGTGNIHYTGNASVENSIETSSGRLLKYEK